jgi:hypothetical protein
MALGTVLAGIPLRRRRRVAAGLVVKLLVTVLMGLALAVLAGSLCCGGSGGGGASPTPTPGRNYTVTVTGTGGVQAKIAVTVQ